MARVLLVLGVLLWSPRSFGAFFFYSAEAVEGWVVDSVSGKPIEGVIVVAHWQLKSGFEGGTPVNELTIVETLTDPSGHYSFPAWGPKFALVGTLEMESPRFFCSSKGTSICGW